MDYKQLITNYYNKLTEAIEILNKDDVNKILNVLITARDEGRQVFIMGNGGSASTASHFVCDFNKGVSYGCDKKFKFICLNDNVATMMAYANDVSYDDVFVNPLMNYFNEGDVVIGISGSGNSKNVVKAIEWANEHGGITVGFTGYSGGKLKQLCKYNVHLPMDDMQIAEDIHMSLCHCMMKTLYKNGDGC